MTTSANSVVDILDCLVGRAFGRLNSVVKPAVRFGLLSPLPVGAGLVVLETTGRTTGLRREVPLVAVRCGSRVRVSTVRKNSQWVKNLQAQPEVSVWVGGRRRSATADVATGRLNRALLSM